MRPFWCGGFGAAVLLTAPPRNCVQSLLVPLFLVETRTWTPFRGFSSFSEVLLINSGHASSRSRSLSPAAMCLCLAVYRLRTPRGIVSLSLVFQRYEPCPIFFLLLRLRSRRAYLGNKSFSEGLLELEAVFYSPPICLLWYAKHSHGVTYFFFRLCAIFIFQWCH